MKNFRIIFAVTSVVLLVVLAVSPFKDFFREWKLTQYRYNDLVAGLPKKVKPAPIGIKQIWNQKLDRVDRCVTCHLGLKEEALKDAQEPFRTHPHIYHDIDEFGCTICHEGQGSATEYKESLGLVKFWDRPILPVAYMEASCAKCHKEDRVPQAPVLNRGRQLIESSNCAGCHKLPGAERKWVPALDGIGTKVNRQWLVSWLKHPKGYFPNTTMPNFLLSDSEANTLADFLMKAGLSGENAKLDPLPAVLVSGTEAQKSKLVDLGSTRFKEARCISCHPINGKGGYMATDLGKVASKVSAQWLYNYVKNPKRLMPGVRMPRFRFTEEELTGVIAYMESEFVDYDLEAAPPHTPDPDAPEKGLAIFKKYNCSGCHTLGNLSKGEEMGPDLTAIGDKRIYEIDFGPSKAEQTLPSYLKTKLLDPRVFSPAMKMPKFEFSESDARAIAVALLGNTKERLPEEYIIRAKPKTPFVPQGEFGALVNDLACQGCHVMNGTGVLVATDLSVEASQAQRPWLESYFKIPYSLRPILTERMPKLFVSDAEIRTIVDYMENVFRSDSLDLPVPSDNAAIARGQALYSERYGCQGCHQIATKGGYVGPPLDKVGTRLKAGWIFHWLKNPQAFRPESIEPNNRLSDDDARSLTAYLMSLK